MVACPRRLPAGRGATDTREHDFQDSRRIGGASDAHGRHTAGGGVNPFVDGKRAIWHTNWRDDPVRHIYNLAYGKSADDQRATHCASGLEQSRADGVDPRGIPVP